MATTPLGIAPVMTPHILGVLADTCEQDHLPEQALFLRSLLPFVEETVKKCFAPLMGHEGRGSFTGRFKKLSSDFEPLRLYVNIKIFSSLAGKEDVLSFYEHFLIDTLNPLMRAARDMNMEPELIAAVIRDYIKILRALSQTLDATFFFDLTVDQVEEFAKWLHAATRLDYALTAVFLILEKSIPAPDFKVRRDLLIAQKKALVDFGQATSRMVPNEALQHVVQELEAPHIQLELVPDDQSGVNPPVAKAEKQSAEQSPNRHKEMNWLARRKDLVGCYGGQWIVLEGDQLIANDVDYLRARETATQKGIMHPFIFFVPGAETGAFMGV